MATSRAAAARRLLTSHARAPSPASHRPCSSSTITTATATATPTAAPSRTLATASHNRITTTNTNARAAARIASPLHATLRHFHSRPPRTAAHLPPLSSINTADHERDNETLRFMFDSPHSPSVSTSSSSSSTPTGLFQIPSLTTPHDFIHLAQSTLARAQLLVDRIARANSPDASHDELRQVVRNLDRLSDLLCGVIDMAELVRNAHPDPNWADAANAAYEYLCGYMNVLNTHTGLYAVLKKLLSTPDIVSSLSEEAVAVANVFLRDFEKSGIHLPPAERERFVQLSDEILVLGRGFLQDIAGNGAPDDEGQGNSGGGGGGGLFSRGSKKQTGKQPTEPHDEPVQIPLDWLKGMNPTLLNALKSSCPHATDSALFFTPSEHPWAFQTILKHAPDEQARKVAFAAANSASRAQVSRLERLLRARAELATLTGAASYAEMSLGDKMAKQPDNVEEFLRALTDHHRPRAARDLDKLRKLKLRDTLARQNGDARTLAAKHTALPAFHAWDRDLYTDAHFRSPSLRSLQPLSPYFSVGSVFAGLSRLFSALYGIRFRAAGVAPGEVWSEGRGDVMKVEVLDEREGARSDGSSATPEGLVGTIYADLWSREGKPGGAAHYTVRCSRRVDLDDEAGDFEHGRSQDGRRVSPSDLGGGAAAAGGGLGNPLQVPTALQRDRPGRFQHPVVVLMCDFPRPSNAATSPCLLGWHEVETLFHEMGHAIHSMIGRTAYHNVSGTRCATDFVELPSILMEHFVSSPGVVEVVARHHATNARMPFEHLESHLVASKSLEGLDTYHQIQLALLDQAYHSPLAAASASAGRGEGEGREFDSSAIYARIDQSMSLSPSDGGLSTSSSSSFPPPNDREGTSNLIPQPRPQTKFSHLFGYGATYYSYLLDRAIASKVFSQLFHSNPLDRGSGERLKEVLRYGGGKDAWNLLAGLLGDERLREGGKVAMRIVGRWGIEEKEGKEGKARL